MAEGFRIACVVSNVFRIHKVVIGIIYVRKSAIFNLGMHALEAQARRPALAASHQVWLDLLGFGIDLVLSLRAGSLAKTHLVFFRKRTFPSIWLENWKL